MSDNYTYPAIIDNNDDKFTDIMFPDFDNAYTCIPKGEDYIKAAQEVLTLAIQNIEENGGNLPKQLKDDEIVVGDNQKLVYINVWLPYHRTQTKIIYVKKTLTIPAWIDELAKANHINFSSTLVEAIKSKLCLK